MHQDESGPGGGQNDLDTRDASLRIRAYESVLSLVFLMIEVRFCRSGGAPTDRCKVEREIDNQPTGPDCRPAKQTQDLGEDCTVLEFLGPFAPFDHNGRGSSLLFYHP